MVKPEKLLERLNDMAQHLSKLDGPQLLLGLGSVGVELARLDAYSDLDFFLIVEEGYKQRFIEKLDWLDDVHPLVYSFQNTIDGHKILFADGIYGEFAVFEYGEMPNINYSGGRIVWKRDDFDPSDLPMQNGPALNDRRETLDYCVNEALTNLYVGLCRFARGEKLNGTYFVENYALGNILKVIHLVEAEENPFVDRYGLDRRVEARHPKFAERLPDFVGGYAHVAESAIAILDYLKSIYPIHPQLANEIRELAKTIENKG
jgi:hypothetical protein